MMSGASVGHTQRLGMTQWLRPGIFWKLLYSHVLYLSWGASLECSLSVFVVSGSHLSGCTTAASSIGIVRLLISGGSGLQEQDLQQIRQKPHDCPGVSVQKSRGIASALLYLWKQLQAHLLKGRVVKNLQPCFKTIITHIVCTFFLQQKHS